MTRQDKHLEHLFRYYHLFGLNQSTIEDKVSHWERQRNPCVSATSDEQKLMIYEISWLVQQFPEDFKYL